MRNRRKLSPLREFAAHAIAASAFFMIIAVPAMALSVFVALSQKYGVSGFVTSVLVIRAANIDARRAAVHR